MPWTRPTLNQLQERISQDLSGRLLNGKPLKPRSVLGVLSWVLAGAFHMVYGFFAWLVQQANPATATGVFLELWCAVWKVKRKPADYARGTVKVTATASTVIAGGSILKSQAGLNYVVSADTEISETMGEVQVEAVEPGSAYNLPVNEILTLVLPIARVQSSCVVVLISDGVDQEDIEELRGRLLDKIQSPPHGGSEADYKHWALEVPGVTRVWPLALYAGAGTVGVTFVCDNLPDPIPTESKVREVYEHIWQEMPVTARPGLIVFAPVRLPETVEMKLIPDTEAVRQAVRKELKDLFILMAAAGTQIPRTHIGAAISRAPGEFDHLLIQPTGNINPQKNEFPVLEEVLFVD